MSGHPHIQRFHRFFLYARLTLVLLALTTGCKPRLPDQKELNNFAQSFRLANSASTIQPMLELYEIAGSSEQTISLLKVAIGFELGMPIKNIEFAELSGAPEETIHFTHKGQAYGPTLEPAYRMRVLYDTEDRFESVFTIGRSTGGNFRFVSSRPIQ